MDLSQTYHQFQNLPQLLDLAPLLAKLGPPLPVPPPNIIRDFLYNVGQLNCPLGIENPPPMERPLNDVPINLCIRDQKMNTRTLEEFIPDRWPFARPPLGSEVHPSIQPQKVNESLVSAQPTRRRAGWKGLSVCAACFKSFNKMSDLNQHYMQRHKDRLEKEWAAALNKRQRRSKTGSRRRMFCDQKDDNTSYSSSSQTPVDPNDRLLGSRSEKGVKKSHICPWCNYCAKWPTELQKHIVVHANLRPFACIICNNCYKWSWDLGRHFSTVHAGLPNPYKMSKKNIRAQLQRNSNCDTMVT